MAADDKQRSLTALRDLRPGMKNVTCVFIVIDKGTTNQTKDGSVVRKCRVADKSASICFSLWNEQAGAIDAGDILKLTKGYASMWKGGMMLYSGKYGILEKIGEFTMVYSESPDMSDPNQEFLQSQQQQQQSPHHHQPPARGGGGGAMGGGNPQQQHHHGHQQVPPMPPQPAPPSNSGYSNSIPPPQGGPHNGRMGMGMNRNGNNHINHGMVSGYASLPPGGPPEGPQGGTNMEGNFSQSEANHFNHSGPPAQPPNFNPPGHQISTKSHPQPHRHYDHQQQGARPNFDPGPPYTHHDDMGPPPQQQYPPHHPHGQSGNGHARTSGRGGFRNFERPHPYSRPPPSDPPRHNGGWR